MIACPASSASHWSHWSKRDFVPFSVTPSSDRVLCVYVPSGYSSRKQFSRGRFFEWLQKYMKNKNKRNENKILLRDINCKMDKMDKNGKKKAQRIYRCRSNYILSKLNLDNGLEDLWRRKNPDFSEFTHCDRSSGTRSRINRVYTDIQIASNTKINHIMISFTDYYNSISIDRNELKSKLEKTHEKLKLNN